MPTVMRIGRYRFFFYSKEGFEPPHIHVEAAEAEAKIWLRGIVVARSHGFAMHELNEIKALLRDNISVCAQAWERHFGK